MPQDTLRVIGFLKKRSDLTHEEFYEHWEKKHAPLVVPWILKHGFISYMQIHTTPLSLASLPGAVDADGCGQMEVKDWDMFLAAMQDPYYAEVIVPDEAKFIDRKTTEVLGLQTVGVQKDFVVDGKAV
ncbi:hypothetical protein BU16DRAFT_524324 [Lophium mytilinum]|uniref:EthD domain-containing protein n=1 Tax=Lophium mytilinum TaxID=390894 RepID=A0A6A6R0E2_9PEZI|nr:hypothetical protein BU16DRAFT_524324 [Lophium mytilinum]